MVFLSGMERNTSKAALNEDLSNSSNKNENDGKIDEDLVTIKFKVRKTVFIAALKSFLF